MYHFPSVCNIVSLPILSTNIADDLTNGKGGKPVPAPQKSLPDLPPPRTVSNVQIHSIKSNDHIVFIQKHMPQSSIITLLTFVYVINL